VSHRINETKKLWESLLLLINNDKPSGIDNLDGKLLRMVADSISHSYLSYL
jgi:hypothetical protein